jgi:hypothetical protein
MYMCYPLAETVVSFSFLVLYPFQSPPLSLSLLSLSLYLLWEM